MLTGALCLALAVTGPLAARAQPAKGAAAAMERVREVMANRFKDTKLTGDPDRDFAELLIASYEETLFLAKAQLDYGGDRQLREMAEAIQRGEQKKIDAIKEWQVRSRQPDYQAQPNQTPSGQGPLDRQAQAGAPRTPSAPAPEKPPSPAPAPAPTGPLVAGTVQKVDEAAGKVTLDHERIPNIDMDAMTMAYRVQDPAMLKGLKPGEKVRFSADRVNGSIAITRIQKGR
ncbi:copper-binding protein [Methylobacterium sp. JK268]